MASDKEAIQPVETHLPEFPNETSVAEGAKTLASKIEAWWEEPRYEAERKLVGERCDGRRGMRCD